MTMTIYHSKESTSTNQIKFLFELILTEKNYLLKIISLKKNIMFC